MSPADLLGLPSLADVGAVAAEYGPIVGLVLLLVWHQARQNERLLTGLLDGLSAVRAAQTDGAVQAAATVSELRGIRSDLAKTEDALRRLAERSADHGESISVHGAKLADHARRIAVLEGHLPPAGVPTTLRRPTRDERA